jgi:hypothetical protein
MKSTFFPINPPIGRLWTCINLLSSKSTPSLARQVNYTQKANLPESEINEDTSISVINSQNKLLAKTSCNFCKKFIEDSGVTSEKKEYQEKMK